MTIHDESAPASLMGRMEQVRDDVRQLPRPEDVPAPEQAAAIATLVHLCRALAALKDEATRVACQRAEVT